MLLPGTQDPLTTSLLPSPGPGDGPEAYILIKQPLRELWLNKWSLSCTHRWLSCPCCTGTRVCPTSEGSLSRRLAFLSHILQLWNFSVSEAQKFSRGSRGTLIPTSLFSKFLWSVLAAGTGLGLRGCMTGTGSLHSQSTSHGPPVPRRALQYHHPQQGSTVLQGPIVLSVFGLQPQVHVSPGFGSNLQAI